MHRYLALYRIPDRDGRYSKFPIQSLWVMAGSLEEARYKVKERLARKHEKYQFITVKPQPREAS